MKSLILGMLAETSLHPGAGQDAGFVDLPVARESATDYPVIVGSSFKGALLDKARGQNIDPTDRDWIFGKQEHSGSLLVSDVRIVLLPVRSLTSHYKWVTCPHLIERLQRDLRRSEIEGAEVGPISVERGHYLGSGSLALFLEERQFNNGGDLPGGLTQLLATLICHRETRDRLSNQVVVLHNDDFSWFARFGLSVSARNVLHPDKKTSLNLWYEESIPADSVFYSMLADRRDGRALEQIQSLINHQPYIQVGGNETIGHGWLAVTILQRGAQ